MPKIQAYTYRNQIIPVADAAEKTVFQCPWTDKIFVKKSQYVKHLKDYRHNRIHIRCRQTNSNRKLQELWNLTSFPEIISWIENNPTVLFDKTAWCDEDKKYRTKFKIAITYLSITHSASVSNTHDCPHNGVTNWSRRDEFRDGTPKPTGYPGWQGRIEYQVSHSLSGITDLLGPARIHTGTGGGLDNHKYGFDVKLFDSDWPSLTSYQVLTENINNSFDYGNPYYFK